METKETLLKKIKLRKIQKTDYKQIIELQFKCFPGMKPWNEKQFNNLLAIFPAGQVCILEHNKIIASSAC